MALKITLTQQPIFESPIPSANIQSSVMPPISVGDNILTRQLAEDNSLANAVPLSNG